MKKENVAKTSAGAGEPAEELKGLKFEEALKKLEKIVGRLESGDVPLEESLSLYEEGISLFRHCSSKLEEAKKKVEILTKKGPSGEIKLEPFKIENTGSSSMKTKEDESDEEEVPF